VIAPDYPGYGQSDAPDRSTFAYTFDRFGELVDGLLDQLGVTPICDLRHGLWSASRLALGA
jgi:pimeloyl-ACP methyl ester carboxylesterase